MSEPIGAVHPDAPDLLERHYRALREGSGIAPEVILERAARSVTDRQVLADLKFAPAQRRVPGMLLPVWCPDGSNGLYTFRPDLPRVDTRGRERKYELPRGVSARLDSPPRCRPMLGNPAIPLWLTEGQKKADALASRGLCAAALLGVWNFKGRNEFGGVVLLADFNLIAWNGRTVNILFDSDLMHKPTVRQALERITEHLRRKGATVNPVYLPDGPDGSRLGVDDYLLANTVEQLERLVYAPKPNPKAAAPRVELLEAAPPLLNRPLALVDGRAYAATWLWVRTTTAESIGKDGEVVRHDPPRVSTSRQLFVVRDDGTVWGPGEPEGVDELGLEVKLAEPPRDGKLWRARGVAAYRAGRRPDPADVFRRVAGVFDYFIDFGRSLATWFSPACTVLGYPWPNGERGSGKTHWGTCWAMTSYLGEVVLAGGTFAALRDLADYGAALLFDDAEALSNPKRSDPNKRELLLAGNRRGASIPLKEVQPDGTWATRWVNAFCPRGFTAINLPDPILASRSVVLPLARTTDPARGNADPADVDRWPYRHADLQDDLWATALHLLPEAAATWAELDTEPAMIGREFEPWRALLMVARLFERHGVEGLEERIRGAMQAYQKEKGELLDSDRTVLVVKALHQAIAAKRAGSAGSDGSAGKSEGVQVSASEIATTVKTLAAEDEREAEWASSERVGRLLKRLRLTSGRTGGKRWYSLTLREAEALARAYGVPVQRGTENETPPPPEPTGTTDQSGTTGTPGLFDGEPDPDAPLACVHCGAELPAGRTYVCAECFDKEFAE